MAKLAFENRVHERLQGKPHLQPVFSGGNHNMDRRIQEYDSEMFVVRNLKRAKFEIHSLGNRCKNTFICDLPYDTLDERIINALRLGDLRTRGPQIFKEIDEENERLDASKARSRRNDLLGIAEELHPYFRNLAWEGV